jgi:hypothetical protein
MSSKNDIKVLLFVINIIKVLLKNLIFIYLLIYLYYKILKLLNNNLL